MPLSIMSNYCGETITAKVIEMTSWRIIEDVYKKNIIVS